MKLETIQDTMWAIHPAKLEEIDAAVRRLLSGEKIDFEASSSGGDEDDRPYSVTSDGIAVIPVTGTLARRANLMTRFSGGTSTQLLKRNIAQALGDDKVTGILLDIDSPGGMVHGTKDAADFIQASRGVKPIVAYTDGLMCSAAYWIASAAGEIVATKTSEVGSIGVALTHYDTTKADENHGIKRTEIYAGKYKRIASGALTREGREYLQDQVDTYYSIFVDNVAKNREVGTEKALSMADGRTFIGDQALHIGLVDRIGNMEVALNCIRKGKKPMTEEQIKKLQAELAETQKELAEAQAGSADMKSLQAELAEIRKEREEMAVSLRRKDIQTRMDKLVSEGKLTPANVDSGMVDFLMAVDGVTYGTGEKAVKASEWFLTTLSTAPPVVPLGETATRGTATDKKPEGADSEVEAGLAIARAGKGE